MRIAVVGTGISGLVAANKLSRDHAVTVFEGEDRIGGHTATKNVAIDNTRYAIDTGFIVFNDRTYPEFIKLMGSMGVRSQPTTMGFSVCCERTGLEYSGGSLNSLFAQRKNIVSPYFLSLVRDILRFNRQAAEHFERGELNPEQTLDEYLFQHKYGTAFVRHYLAPMAAAIWSSSQQAVLDFPVLFFVRFFKNHGLLQIRNRPQWRTLTGGSSSYLEPITQPFKEHIRLSCPVRKITRNENKVTVLSDQFGEEEFDHVVVAAHADQALSVLGDASKAEQDILGAMPYSKNTVVLHTDTRVLPERRSTWSSWNYRITASAQELPVLSYNMNILQRIESEHTFCVTLNHDQAIDQNKILGRYEYAHPEFSAEAVAAQERWAEINGMRNTWYCGAYWRNGFHEDGVFSALRVVEQLHNGS
ncbi:MAG: NAD(P)/FAD-dependent oxidoreductase [Pseudomonadales bacterium]